MKGKQPTALRSGSLLFPWPIGVPDAGLEIPSPRDEPREGASEEPDFGEGPCGDAAARLWQEHLNDSFTRLLGPSPAHEQYLKERAERCRQIGVPGFSGPCAGTARLAYARCIILGDGSHEAERKAQIAMRFCVLIRDRLADVIRPSWGPWI
jgi:hypothetical protein